MKTRSQKAHRILNVLKQIHSIEEFKKAELQRRLAELENSQHAVIHALNTDDALHGLFIDQTAKFLKSLAIQADKVVIEKDEQSKRLLENASKMKQAERLKDALVLVERRAQNEAELADIIEQHAAKTNASPRQVSTTKIAVK